MASVQIVLDTRKNPLSKDERDKAKAKNDKGEAYKKLLSTVPRYVKVRVTDGTVSRYYPTSHKSNAEEKNNISASLDLNRRFTIKEFTGIMYGAKLSPEQKNYKNAYNSFLKKAEDIVSNLPVFSWDEFERLYKKNRGAKDSLKAAFDEVEKRQRKEGRISTASATGSAAVAFEKFKPGAKLADVSPQFLEGFQAWMISKGRTTTSIGMYSRAIRSLLNEAIADGRLHESRYPFRKRRDEKNKYKIPVSKNIKKALSTEHLQKLFYYKSEDKSKQSAADFWRFSYLANGMNMKDIFNLKWKDISDDIIQFTRAKTSYEKEGQKIVVPLTDELQTIMSKYGVRSLVGDAYVFPFVFKSGMDEETKYKELQKIVQRINKNLSKICTEIKIPQIRTYSARHSFATTLKNAGQSVAFISESLGHSSVGTTEAYLASFGLEKKKEAAKSLIPPAINM